MDGELARKIVLALLLYALVMLLTIPAVWILLGVGGAAYAIYRIARRIARERLEMLFLDTIAALHASDPRAAELLSTLEDRGWDDADAWLLVAAHAACRARYQDALAALERAAARVPSIGRLSSGMTLAFPGLPAPLPFRPEGGGAGSIEVARAQIHVLDGHPRTAVGGFNLSASDPSGSAERPTPQRASSASAVESLCNLGLRAQTWSSSQGHTHSSPGSSRQRARGSSRQEALDVSDVARIGVA